MRYPIFMRLGVVYEKGCRYDKLIQGLILFITRIGGCMGLRGKPVFGMVAMLRS